MIYTLHCCFLLLEAVPNSYPSHGSSSGFYSSPQHYPPHGGSWSGYPPNIRPGHVPNYPTAQLHSIQQQQCMIPGNYPGSSMPPKRDQKVNSPLSIDNNVPSLGNNRSSGNN